MRPLEPPHRPCLHPSGSRHLQHSAGSTVGCGTGALSEIILAHASPASVLAVDSSGRVPLGLQNADWLDLRITFWIGGLPSHLPSDAHDMQVAVSGLVLNFIPEPVIALRASMSCV